MKNYKNAPRSDLPKVCEENLDTSFPLDRKKISRTFRYVTFRTANQNRFYLVSMKRGNLLLSFIYRLALLFDRPHRQRFHHV
jgi:hypothetical protein